MYPNDYCKPCNNNTPTPGVEPPSACSGEPCAELYNTQCTIYDGPDIPCLNIVADDIAAPLNMNEVLTLISQIFCGCQIPVFEGTSTTETISITITSALTSIDLFEVEYSIDEMTWNTLDTPLVPGQYTFTIEGLYCGTTYYIRIQKVCLEPTSTFNSGAYSDWQTLEVVTQTCL